MAARLSEETVTKTGSGDKRALILDAALNLFRHYGYRRTSMEDIARAANVAKGTLYIYFKSKDELFEALARQLARNVEASLNAVIDRELEPEEKISALLEAKLGFAYCWVLSSPHAAEILESSARIKEGVFEPVDRLFRSAVAQAIREGTRRGLFDPKAAGLTLEGAADTLIAAAYGAEKAAGSESQFRDRLARIVRLGLRGLRKPA